jgi:hypothetical protein
LQFLRSLKKRKKITINKVVSIMNAEEVADIVRSIIAETSSQQRPIPSQNSKISKTSHGVSIPVNSRVEVIENNRIQPGIVVAINKHSWYEIECGGHRFHLRPGQLLLTPHSQASGNCASHQATQASSAHGIPQATEGSQTQHSRTATFSWLYVPLIALAESMKINKPPRVTLFKSDVAQERIGTDLFTECAALLSTTITDSIPWSNNYISPAAQESLISTVNTHPSFQQMLMIASAATSTVPGATTPPARRGRSLSSSVSLPAVTTPLQILQEGEDL